VAATNRRKIDRFPGCRSGVVGNHGGCADSVVKQLLPDLLSVVPSATTEQWQTAHCRDKVAGTATNGPTSMNPGAYMLPGDPPRRPDDEHFLVGCLSCDWWDWFDSMPVRCEKNSSHQRLALCFHAACRECDWKEWVRENPSTCGNGHGSDHLYEIER
jgi:hypothetical protein